MKACFICGKLGQHAESRYGYLCPKCAKRSVFRCRKCGGTFSTVVKTKGAICDACKMRIRTDAQNVQARIANYLGNGGLFNPELMEHEKVRDLIIDCRSAINALHNDNNH